jgi:hypothetical protein
MLLNRLQDDVDLVPKLLRSIVQDEVVLVSMLFGESSIKPSDAERVHHE